MDTHTAIIIRMASVYKSSIILLDEKLGKIEAKLVQYAGSKKHLFHGALISCSLSKRTVSYTLTNIMLLDAPFYWAEEHLLFFHHVLELCHSFLNFDEEASEVFALVKQLYSDPMRFKSSASKKEFLCHFFKLVGMYEQEAGHDTNTWLRACISAHPHAASLNTAHFLTTLDSNDEN